MGKMRVQFVFVGLLILLLTLTATATRPLHSGSPFRDEEALKHPTTGAGEGSTEEGFVEASCEGVDEEECVIRRTLAAHTDYIYTQHHNP